MTSEEPEHQWQEIVRSLNCLFRIRASRSLSLAKSVGLNVGCADFLSENSLANKELLRILAEGVRFELTRERKPPWRFSRPLP